MRVQVLKSIVDISYLLMCVCVRVIFSPSEAERSAAPVKKPDRTWQRDGSLATVERTHPTALPTWWSTLVAMLA